MSAELSPGMVGQVIEVKITGAEGDHRTLTIAGRLAAYSTDSEFTSFHFEKVEEAARVRTRNITEITTWSMPFEVQIIEPVRVMQQ